MSDLKRYHNGEPVAQPPATDPALLELRQINAKLVEIRDGSRRGHRVATSLTVLLRLCGLVLLAPIYMAALLASLEYLTR